MATTTYLLNRKITHTNPANVPTAENSISFLQWNALSSNLGTPEAFPKADPNSLVPTYRLPIIAEEIKAYAADFTSLEEIESADAEFYGKILEDKGFKTVFHQKNGGTDGLAFIYNANRFEVVESKLDAYFDTQKNKKYTQIYQVHVFKQKNLDKHYLIVGLTHLKAKKENVATRLEQADQLVKILKETQEALLAKEEGITVGAVVCGDLNDEPDSEPLKIILEGTKFASVFAGELYTTFKIREKEYKRVIDYIFHNDKLELVAKNDIPNWELIGVDGLPNNTYPSDHLSLYAQFQWKN